MRSHNQATSLHDPATLNQIGPNSQVVSGMANMNMMGDNMRNQKNVYNSKFNTGGKTGSEAKNTPQHVISSKIGGKQGNRGDA